MSYLIVVKSILYFVFLFCNYPNQENEVMLNMQNKHVHGLVENLTGECDLCYSLLISTCCCKVTLNQTQSIDLYVCGVATGENNTDCNMDTGDGCYDVQEVKGVHRTLTAFFPSFYFCVDKTKPFTLCNANGSGQGYIYLDCNGSGVPPGGQYGINLSYTTGGWCRYIQPDNACDLTFCSF